MQSQGLIQRAQSMKAIATDRPDVEPEIDLGEGTNADGHAELILGGAFWFVSFQTSKLYWISKQMKTLTRILALVSFFAIPSLVAQTGGVFSDDAKPRQATVTILALSTATHNGYSGSQDIYFAYIKTAKKEEQQFVKLVDIYEGYGYPIRRSLLTNRAVFRMEVVRQTECDMLGSQLFLPSSAQVYDGGTSDLLKTHADDVVPCYRTVHKSIKLAKKK